jgi:hypothetical protein
MQRLLEGALFGFVIVIGSPAPATAQQLYECTYTITIMKITTTYNDGTIHTEVRYSREETCRPI